MCGIAGRFNFRTARPVEARSLTAMCDLIRHRGPDGDGTWTSGAVGFGHRRLAIIDLSPGGHQPMSTADGRLTITFNGEIYNFEELRQQLEARGHRFRSRSDTEVILHAYDEFGVECLSHLRGMFAFVIWDERTRRLFAARDRAGKKPLYYREDADGLVFASEPKAFLAEPSFVPEAEPNALFHYLSLQYVPAAESAFAGVRRLPPAHYLLVEDGRVSVTRYWTLRYSPKLQVSEEEAEAQTLDLLREATKLRMISDVPLGAFLSGGVDSSLIVALMAEVGAGQVKTFSIGFEEEAYNELPYARMVAKRFGTDHHETIVRPDAVAILPKLIWHYNEPYADSSSIPTMYLAQMTRRHVTVALNGDAGDENFAGYTRYVASLLARRFDRIPLPLRRVLAALTGGAVVPDSLMSRARRFLQAAAETPERRYARWMFHFFDAQKQHLCTPEFLARVTAPDSATLLEQLFAQARGEDLLDATLHVDVHSYLPDDLLVKVDIATMAHSLEGRSPFLDHQVMEYAAALPTSLKLRGTDKKYLLKRIARRYLPAELIDRPKMGFGVPLDHWFRGELNALAHDVLLDSRARQRGYFRMTEVERMLREHEQRQHNWHYQLWNLLVFELWHRMFIDARPNGAPSDVAAEAMV
ncbi:MAG: asparagine synthase (glutamine-hydrolyzing) [Vicinamibacterales bacterium]